MTSDDLVVAQFCIQFVPLLSQTDRIEGAWAERLTHQAPRKPLAGAVSVMMAVQIPRAAFSPLRTQLVTVQLASGAPGFDQLPAAGQVL